MTTDVNDNDTRVSNAYREIADETTPPELDRKIMAMASAEVRTQRGFRGYWLKPLGWAATIALSFAVLLEYSQFDDAPTVAAVAQSEMVHADAIEEMVVTGDQAQAEVEMDPPARLEMSKRSADAPASAKASMSDSANVMPAPAAENAPALGRAQDNDAAALRTNELIRSQAVQERAEESFADMQGVVASPSAMALEAKEERRQGCDEEAQATAATWYACIEELRDADNNELAKLELATLEYEALLAEFPDFREPLHSEQEDGAVAR